MITSLLSLGIMQYSHAQEMVMDSVNRSKFTGIHQGDEMGQFIYIPYFNTNKADKKNFIIRQLNAQNFSEDKTLRFELPGTYTLRGSAFGGESYFLHFYNEAGKEDVFMVTSGDNIIKKKTVKSSDERHYIYAGSGPEDFVIVSIDGKGNYKVKKVDKDLENKWEKKFAAPSGTNRDIISINNKMGGRLEIVRKDNMAGNKYEFSVHSLLLDSGEDIGQNTFADGNTKLYPTFFSEKDGMGFTGGYYFSEGVYSDKPLGVFFASLTPDGGIERIAKVPYSQVIEDLKNTVGSQISGENTSIIFTTGYLAHETQQFVMIGQVVNRQDNENSSTFNFGDFVSVKFSIEEQTFKGAVSTSYNGRQTVIKGNPQKTNTLDLGIWMNNSSLLPYSHSVNMPGNAILAYKDYDKDGRVNICFRASGIKNDTTRPECMMLFRELQKNEPYIFPGNVNERPAVYAGIIPSVHDIGHVATYELKDNILLLTKTPLPRFDRLMVPPAPEDPARNNDGHEPPPPEENEQAE